MSFWNTWKCLQISMSTPKLPLNFHQRMQIQNKQLSWLISLYILLCCCQFHHRASGTDSTWAYCLYVQSQLCIFNPQQQGVKGKASHVGVRHNHLYFQSHICRTLHHRSGVNREAFILPWFRYLHLGSWTHLWFAFRTEDCSRHWWLGKMHCNICLGLQRRKRRKGSWSSLVPLQDAQYLTEHGTGKGSWPWQWSYQLWNYSFSSTLEKEVLDRPVAPWTI